MVRHNPLIILFVFLILTAFAPAGAQADAVADALHNRMEELQFTGNLEIGGARIAAHEILPALYANREFQPLWTDEARIHELLALLETASEHGLETEDYYVAELKSQVAEARTIDAPLDKADRDILLTEAFIRFGYHQLFGKVTPGVLDSNINFSRKFLDGREPIMAIPEIIGSAKPLQKQLDDNVHRGPVYRQLQRHLADHRQIAEAGGWPAVPVGNTLRRGDSDPRVVALRERLAVTADLPIGSDTTSTVFDDNLEAAVIRFQERHALASDGVVGNQTYLALNVPVETRIDQLRLSLERLRWVRGEQAERFVAVNIAGFRVFFVIENNVAWTSRAMVGKIYRQTPIFRGNMRYLEINPTWTVPPGILTKDVLPAIKRDPGYLQAKNMSVIDRDGRNIDPATINWKSYSRGIPYTIRQEPGPKNALGEIKFIFPNKHFVFLHDTPGRGLFDRAERTFSSGCIRVENPFELAELVLNDPKKWDRQALQRVRDTRQTQRINTPNQVMVLILYLTASIERDGRPRFLKDVYNRDARLLKALDGPVRIELPKW